MSEKTFELSHAVKEKIDYWLAKYPREQRQSALLPALHIVQDAHAGWLSEPALQAVAHYLDLPFIAVMEVATFYTMYHLAPVGQHQIDVCTNISCMLRGSDKIAAHLKNKLGIQFGETTPDGKFTLREVECLAACSAAPACMVDKTYHEHLTPDSLDTLLSELSS